jgi:antitoxin VapB
MLAASAEESVRMPAQTARIFRNGRNQALRIPVELSLDTDEVTIEKQGEALIVRPVPRRGWDCFFSDPTLVLPSDFDPGDDLPPQERQPL